MYKLIIIGGTFDNLHKGHKEFLDFCLKKSQKILLGLTTDAYAKETKEEKVETYQKRKNNLTKYFKSKNSLSKVNILPINSFMYPKSWEKLSIEAIVVTKETKRGAVSLNRERKNKGLNPLKIVNAPMVFVHGEKVSSTKIRKGEINKYGISYLAKEWFDKDLILGGKERHWFKKPFGKLLTSEEINFLSLDPERTATVGDFITRLFNEKNVKNKVSVIDFNIERKKSFENIFDLGFIGNEKIFKTKNRAGTISKNLFKTIVDITKNLNSKDRIIISILGEEDLAVLPLVLALPLGWTIFYGQPGKGAVMLKVDPKSKSLAYKLLTRFTKEY